jgi:hypothetical protein
MNPDANPHDKLEASIDRVLRSVPQHRSPVGFEARVLAEIARRQALPWWRQSYRSWPVAMRAAFFFGSAVAAGLAVSTLVLLFRAQPLADLAVGSVAWLREISSGLGYLAGIARSAASSIPTLYYYAPAGIFTAVYAVLGAVGATTYRLLHPARSNA